MKFLKPLFVFAIAVFAISPALAEEGKAVSYGLKKQGRVHFQDKMTEEQPAAAEAASESVSPADIEPAAGAMEDAVESGEASVSERIRLPRKN